MDLKVLSTQIDETSVELTYSDNPLVDAAAELVVVRMPLQGPLVHSVLWHQMQTLYRLSDWAGKQARILRSEIEAQR